MAEATETNFTVHNVTLDRPAPFVFFEPREESQNGFFDAFEFIFLYEDLDGNETTDPEPTYLIRPASTVFDGEFPRSGDVFALGTSKPFISGDAFRFVASLTVDAEGESTPRTTRLDAAFPNPFQDAATLRYAVGEPGPVRLTVYDVLGREVAVLVDDVRAAGEHTARLDARHLASGVYIVRLDATGGVTRTERVTVANDETVLDAAERAGLGLPFGCETGACGTCTARLLSGAVDHRRPPRALKDRHRERGYVLTCVATPRTDR